MSFVYTATRQAGYLLPDGSANRNLAYRLFHTSDYDNVDNGSGWEEHTPQNI